MNLIDFCRLKALLTLHGQKAKRMQSMFQDNSIMMPTGAEVRAIARLLPYVFINIEIADEEAIATLDRLSQFWRAYNEAYQMTCAKSHSSAQIQSIDEKWKRCGS